jgi:hypothetical protein
VRLIFGDGRAGRGADADRLYRVAGSNDLTWSAVIGPMRPADGHWFTTPGWHQVLGLGLVDLH